MKITEAVEVAAKARHHELYSWAQWENITPSARARYRDEVRVVATAVFALLTDDGAAAERDYVSEWLQDTGGALPATPAIDREALVRVMNAHPIGAFNGSQVVCGCNLTWQTSAEYRTHLADAVLALIGGAA